MSMPFPQSAFILTLSKNEGSLAGLNPTDQTKNPSDVDFILSLITIDGRTCSGIWV